MTTTTSAGTLSRAALAHLPAAQRPFVDGAELEPRIVHLGLGAFHRAHQAVYTEEAAAATGEPWGVVAVVPRDPGLDSMMRRQDCLYSVTELRGAAGSTRVVGSIVDAVSLRTDPARVGRLLADAAVSVVTLTVTEKGYARLAADGRLDPTAPGLADDLAGTAHDQPCVTVVGALAGGLVARHRAGGAPVSVVSCDNMAGNGAALRTVVRDFVERSGWPDRSAVLDWLDTSVAFPATVVDRIVPATTDADRERVAAVLGVRDALAVAAEPYRQWVLQDSFTADRPRWEDAGAVFVDDVAPYQLTKLRLLNGAHSLVAYLGLAAGCETVSEVLDTGWGADAVRAFGGEVAPTLPPGAPDAEGYVEDLVERFANPGLRHRLTQIGSDGSLKVPERWFGPLRDLRAQGAPTPTLELALAAWVAATGPSSAGPGHQAYGTADPAAAALRDCWRPDGSPDVAGLLRRVGADDLADADDLVAAVAERVGAVRAGHLAP